MSADAPYLRLAKDVNTLLSSYDDQRQPALLRDAADQIVREDGIVPADLAIAHAVGKERLTLWLQIFMRFHRDLIPDFDFSDPPSTTVAPPKTDGRQMREGVRPADVKDPVARKIYEDNIAQNRQRLREYMSQSKLREIRESLRARAVKSIRNACETLGLKKTEIEGALSLAQIDKEDQILLMTVANP